MAIWNFRPRTTISLCSVTASLLLAILPLEGQSGLSFKPAPLRDHSQKRTESLIAFATFSPISFFRKSVTDMSRSI